MSEFNKNGNDKIDKLQSHKTFIDKVLIKYKEAIQNDFKATQLSYYKSENALQCYHCGHCSINAEQMNLHLITHQKDHILSASQWDVNLIAMVNCYASENVQAFTKEFIDKLLKSKESILPPSNKLNPNKVYGVPEDLYQIDARNHNKHVLQNYFQSTRSSFPESMHLQKALQLKKFDQIDYRDCNGRFLEAVILEKVIDTNKGYTKHGIHYENFTDQFNHWSIPRLQFQRYAVYQSISNRTDINRNCMKYIKLNKPYGDYLEIKPMHLFYHNMFKMNHQQEEYDPITMNNCNQYLQWHVAQVISNDRAQVQCVLFKDYMRTNKWIKSHPPQIYWVHLDNEKECAPINTHCAFKAYGNINK